MAPVHLHAVEVVAHGDADAVVLAVEARDGVERFRKAREVIAAQRKTRARVLREPLGINEDEITLRLLITAAVERRDAPVRERSLARDVPVVHAVFDEGVLAAAEGRALYRGGLEGVGVYGVVVLYDRVIPAVEAELQQQQPAPVRV